MTSIDAGDALAILTEIKLYHNQQDNSTAACEAWARALNHAGVTNVRDAIEAVERHYATPGANPWIIPGDVVGHYRALRNERVKDINDGDLTPDLDPFAPVSVYLGTHKARYAAVEDGMPRAAAIATIAPVKMIEAAK